MPKQTNNSSNNAALKGFALTLVILILAVCVMAAMTEGFSNWNPYGWFDKPAEEQQTPEGDDPAPEQPTEDPAPIEATISNGKGISLAYAAATTAAESAELTATVTAEVTPADSGFTLGWSLEWMDPEQEASIDDYVTITNEGNVCTIHVTAPFDMSDIILRASINETGASATCILSYEGLPSEIYIGDLDGLAEYQSSGWGKTLYFAQSGSTYNIQLEGKNAINDTYTDFSNVTAKVTLHGSFKVKKQVRKFGTGKIEDYGTVTVDLDKAAETGATTEESNALFWISQYLIGFSVLNQDYEGFDISGNLIAIDCLNAIESIDMLDVGYWTDARSQIVYTFDSWTDSTKLPYMQIDITDNTTGLTTQINILIQANGGIILSDETIVF